MENMEANVASQKFFDYAVTLPEKEDVIAKFKENTVKGSQFKQPLLEFSGALCRLWRDTLRKTDHPAVW